jgi:GT2 family glycosyltransferase
MLIESSGTPGLLSGTDPPANEYDADIIILALNRMQETLEAVESALGQRMVKIHVSVLDQGSTLENKLALAEAINGCSNVSYFASSKNLGVGGGRNFLSSIGLGRIIVSLDNDATFADDLVVYNALTTFDDDPMLGAIAFNILSRDGRHIDDGCWGYPPSLKRRFEEGFKTTTFVGAGHAIRRQTWDEAGGYDAALFFTWEEYDFCLRAIALGWTISYAGSLQVLHGTCAEERVKWRAGRARLFVRNRLIIGRKWRAPWLFLLPRIIGYIASGAINRLLFASIIGVLQAISLDGNIMKHRMTPEMRIYIRENELRHRGPLYLRVKAEVLKLRLGVARQSG